MTVIAKGSRHKEVWLTVVLFCVAAVPLCKAFLGQGGLPGFLAAASIKDLLLLLMAPIMIGTGLWWLWQIRRHPAPDLIIRDGQLQQAGWFSGLPIEEIVGVNFKAGNIFTRTRSRLTLELGDGSVRELATIRLQGDGDTIARAIAAALHFESPPPPHLRSRGDADPPR